MANNQDTGKAKDWIFGDMVSNWLGYVSSIDKTNIAENILVQGSQNVYKKLSGTIAVREGLKRIGAPNTDVSSCSSEFVWDTSWGEFYTMVVSDGFLWVVINGLWYSLMSTIQTRYVFDSWWDNTLKKDDVLFVNGTDALYEWGGGFGFIASTTSNTIVLDRTIAASFLPSTSGNVIINGNTYAYTGSSGSTLIDVSGDPTGEANGSGVLQQVQTNATTPEAGFMSDFLKVVNNQVYIGSYSSREIFISNSTDYTDFSVPDPRVQGSPEHIVLGGTGKGIGVRQGNACIGFGTSGWSVISFADQTVNNILTNVTTNTIKPVAILQAPLAHEFIGSVGDNLVYLSQDQQLREFGDFNDAFVSVYPSLSQEVATELSAEDFDGGGIRCIGEYIYLTAPVTGRMYQRQERTRIDPNGIVVSEKLWHPPWIINATFVDQINGVVVSFSNENPQIYQLLNTGQWHDDSPSEENLPYTSIIALGYRNLGRRANLQSFDKVFTEGYIAVGTPLNLTLNYNYLGSTNTITTIINSNAQPVYLFGENVSSGDTSSASLGESSLGDEVLGQGGIPDVVTNDLPKFKCINSLSIINCFEWQPIYFSDVADSNWELLAAGNNSKFEAEQNANFIINKPTLT